MAAATFTDTTIIELMRECVKDLGSSDWNFVPEAVYKRLVFRRLLKHTTFTFQRVTTKLWNYSIGPIHIYGMSLTGNDDCIYHKYADGSIEQTTGDEDTSELLEVEGCEVDFGKLMSDFLFFLATNHADEIATSGAGVGKSPGNIRKQLMEMAAMWDGARGDGKGIGY